MLSHKAQFLLTISILHQYQDGEISEACACELLDLDLLSFRTLLENRYTEDVRDLGYQRQTSIRMDAGDFENFCPIWKGKEWDVEASYNQLNGQWNEAKSNA